MTEHEFIIWLTRTALAPDWSENGEFYQELILRKLTKVGTVIARDGSYEIVTEGEHDVRR